jgi:hypothetical protein
MPAGHAETGMRARTGKGTRRDANRRRSGDLGPVDRRACKGWRRPEGRCGPEGRCTKATPKLHVQDGGRAVGLVDAEMSGRDRIWRPGRQECRDNKQGYGGAKRHFRFTLNDPMLMWGG